MINVFFVASRSLPAGEAGLHVSGSLGFLMQTLGHPK